MTSALYPLARLTLERRLAAGDAALAGVMSAPQVFRAGDVLVSDGAPSEAVYKLHSGWATRCRHISDGKRQIIAVFLPGDIAGVKSMLLERQPDAIECLTDITVQKIDQAALSRLAEANYDVALRLMFQLGEDERRLHNWVAALGKGDAEERMATFLLDLRGRLHRLGFVKNDSFRLPMTQQQIGDHLGLTVVHVNRVLRRLREAGVASITNRVAEIRNPQVLGHLAAPLQDVFERENPEFSGGPLADLRNRNHDPALDRGHVMGGV